MLAFLCFIVITVVQAQYSDIPLNTIYQNTNYKGVIFAPQILTVYKHEGITAEVERFGKINDIYHYGAERDKLLAQISGDYAKIRTYIRTMTHLPDREQYINRLGEDETYVVDQVSSALSLSKSLDLHTNRKKRGAAEAWDTLTCSGGIGAIRSLFDSSSCDSGIDAVKESVSKLQDSVESLQNGLTATNSALDTVKHMTDDLRAFSIAQANATNNRFKNMTTTIANGLSENRAVSEADRLIAEVRTISLTRVQNFISVTNVLLERIRRLSKVQQGGTLLLSDLPNSIVERAVTQGRSLCISNPNKCFFYSEETKSWITQLISGINIMVAANDTVVTSVYFPMTSQIRFYQRYVPSGMAIKYKKLCKTTMPDVLDYDLYLYQDPVTKKVTRKFINSKYLRTCMQNGKAVYHCESSEILAASLTEKKKWTQLIFRGDNRKSEVGMYYRTHLAEECDISGLRHVGNNQYITLSETDLEVLDEYSNVRVHSTPSTPPGILITIECSYVATYMINGIRIYAPKSISCDNDPGVTLSEIGYSSDNYNYNMENVTDFKELRESQNAWEEAFAEDLRNEQEAYKRNDDNYTTYTQMSQTYLNYSRIYLQESRDALGKAGTGSGSTLWVQIGAGCGFAGLALGIAAWAMICRDRFKLTTDPTTDLLCLACWLYTGNVNSYVKGLFTCEECSKYVIPATIVVGLIIITIVGCCIKKCCCKNNYKSNIHQLLVFSSLIMLASSAVLTSETFQVCHQVEESKINEQFINRTKNCKVGIDEALSTFISDWTKYQTSSVTWSKGHCADVDAINGYDASRCQGGKTEMMMNEGSLNLMAYDLTKLSENSAILHANILRLSAVRVNNTNKIVSNLKKVKTAVDCLIKEITQSTHNLHYNITKTKCRNVTKYLPENIYFNNFVRKFDHMYTIDEQKHVSNPVLQEALIGINAGPKYMDIEIPKTTTVINGQLICWYPDTIRISDRKSGVDVGTVECSGEVWNLAKEHCLKHEEGWIIGCGYYQTSKKVRDIKPKVIEVIEHSNGTINIIYNCSATPTTSGASGKKGLMFSLLFCVTAAAEYLCDAPKQAQNLIITNWVSVAVSALMIILTLVRIKARARYNMSDCDYIITLQNQGYAYTGMLIVNAGMMIVYEVWKSCVEFFDCRNSTMKHSKENSLDKEESATSSVSTIPSGGISIISRYRHAVSVYYLIFVYLSIANVVCFYLSINPIIINISTATVMTYLTLSRERFNRKSNLFLSILFCLITMCVADTNLAIGLGISVPVIVILVVVITMIILCCMPGGTPPPKSHVLKRYSNPVKQWVWCHGRHVCSYLCVQIEGTYIRGGTDREFVGLLVFGVSSNTPSVVKSNASGNNKFILTVTRDAKFQLKVVGDGVVSGPNLDCVHLPAICTAAELSNSFKIPKEFRIKKIRTVISDPHGETIDHPSNIEINTGEAIPKNKQDIRMQSLEDHMNMGFEMINETMSKEKNYWKLIVQGTARPVLTTLELAILKSWADAFGYVWSYENPNCIHAAAALLDRSRADSINYDMNWGAIKNSELSEAIKQLSAASNGIRFNLTVTKFCNIITITCLILGLFTPSWFSMCLFALKSGLILKLSIAASRMLNKKLNIKYDEGSICHSEITWKNHTELEHELLHYEYCYRHIIYILLNFIFGNALSMILTSCIMEYECDNGLMGSNWRAILEGHRETFRRCNCMNHWVNNKTVSQTINEGENVLKKWYENLDMCHTFACAYINTVHETFNQTAICRKNCGKGTWMSRLWNLPKNQQDLENLYHYSVYYLNTDETDEIIAIMDMISLEFESEEECSKDIESLRKRVFQPCQGSKIQIEWHLPKDFRDCIGNQAETKSAKRRLIVNPASKLNESSIKTTEEASYSDGAVVVGKRPLPNSNNSKSVIWLYMDVVTAYDNVFIQKGHPDGTGQKLSQSGCFKLSDEAPFANTIAKYVGSKLKGDNYRKTYTLLDRYLKDGELTEMEREFQPNIPDEEPDFYEYHGVRDEEHDAESN